MCSACGESFLSEQAMEELERRAKDAGVWGLGQKVRVAKSGNSLVIRAPADLARFLRLKAGTEVFLHPEGVERMVVEVEE